MKKIVLSVVLVLILIGSVVGGIAVATGAPAVPTLNVYGNSAPGLVVIMGKYWTRGVPVDLYMDAPPYDAAHHVAVVTPNSKGNLEGHFVVGPTTLGNHEIIGVQNSTEVHVLLSITSTQQVDDRTWNVTQDINSTVNDINSMLDNSTYGLAEIKKEVAAIEARGNLMMGPDRDTALLAAGYTQLYQATPYFNLTGNMSWKSMNYLSLEARTYHTAVWTGSEMIVWGGVDNWGNFLNTGGVYNLATDTWTTMNTTGAPGGREAHTAVWTGSEMLVWGGVDNLGNLLNTGGRYNPATDTWTAMNTSGAPEGREVHTAVWTGSEMIIWGGMNIVSGNFNYLNTGGRYNPATDTWMTMSPTDVSDARWYHTAVWTGSEMLVWGGIGNYGFLNTGNRYNPSNDTWTDISTIGAPEARYLHTAIWTGSEMLVWGGNNYLTWPLIYNTGGRYNPSNNTWTAISTDGAPQARYLHTAVWTGSEMLIWGGETFSDPYTLIPINTGSRYNPSNNTWTDISTIGAPEARYLHTAIWTGSEMLIWGGYRSVLPHTLGTGGCLQLDPYYYYVKQ